MKRLLRWTKRSVLVMMASKSETAPICLAARDLLADSDAESNSELESGRTSSTDQQIIDRSHEVSLDIDEIATSLSKHLNTKKVFSQASCIYRVPARLWELNEKAYTPRVVSIGPIHHGKKNLKAMEDHKIMYLQQFIEQSKVSVGDLINVFKGYETKLRDCYAETNDLNREDFAIMILLDAVFIIMVLLKFNNVGKSRKSGSGDQIFSPPFKFVDVVYNWMANLKQVYFNNPWTGISVVAAAFLLVLTAIQTVCSILQL